MAENHLNVSIFECHKKPIIAKVSDMSTLCGTTMAMGTNKVVVCLKTFFLKHRHHFLRPNRLNFQIFRVCSVFYTIHCSMLLSLKKYCIISCKQCKNFRVAVVHQMLDT